MKSPLNQMDLEEWELLPDEGFLEINDDGGNKIYSRKYPKGSTNSVFQMNYFIPKPTPQFVENTRVPNHLLPVPIDLGQTSLKQDDDDDDDDDDEERAIKEVAKKIPVEIKIMPPATEKIKAFSSTGLVAADQDPVSQVFFFKKMKETEFVDMKVLDSPKSSSTSTSPNWGIMPQIEGTGGAFQFDQEKGDPCKEAKDDSELAIKNNKDMEIDEEEGGLNLNVWKWSLTGIGAICSFGVAAAATFCIIVFGSTHQKNKHSRQNQNFQFQIYSNDKRMKQMVHQASKLNEAISAAGTVRGVPITRAQITFGGYYDASL